jgi:hypothetical protein
MSPTNVVDDIRDIRDFVPIPTDWRWWVAFAALVVIAAAVFWWWKRRQPEVVAPVVAPLTPYEIAKRALQQLHADNPTVGVFYTRLSDIVRHYIEERFGLRAPERTTEEFLAEANLPSQQMTLLSAFLVECDLVKFARHQPDAADRQRAFAAAEKFVEETR